jgi:uncharacterized protein YjbJ (UPF0337 family)
MDDITNDAQRDLHEEEARGRKEQAAGAVDELKGKVKKNVGDAFDNERMQAEGAAEELGGKARKQAGDAYADAADRAEDAVDRRR